jgi:hypothetical protein
MELPQAFRLGDLGVAVANVPPIPERRKRLTWGAALPELHSGALPFSLVGEGGVDAVQAGRGVLSAETDPSPVSNELALIRSTLSHKGRGEAGTIAA